MERLRRRSDFRAAATGVRASASAFLLQARRRADEGAARVGFTVSRQVGNAVERNRVRRRLREIVRLAAVASSGAGAAAGAALRAGHDYVLIGRRAALALPFGEMMHELGTTLGRVHSQVHASVRGGAGGTAGGLLHEAGSSARRQRPPQSRESSEKPPGNADN